MQRVWKTSDGSTFETKAQAERHEIDATLIKTIKKHVDTEDEIKQVMDLIKAEKDAIQIYCKATTPTIRRKKAK